MVGKKNKTRIFLIKAVPASTLPTGRQAATSPSPLTLDPQPILSFIFELGMLKKIKHEGWRFAGITDPESVADHSTRAAQIAFLLAKMEGYPHPFEVVTMAVFHDIGECRLGDIHKIGAIYNKTSEKKAIKDQTAPLKEIGINILELWEKVEYRKGTAGLIAKDSDLLEQAITAKEYMENGYAIAKKWIEDIQKKLKTNSAKKIIKMLLKSDPHQWWVEIALSRK